VNVKSLTSTVVVVIVSVWSLGLKCASEPSDEKGNAVTTDFCLSDSDVQGWSPSSGQCRSRSEQELSGEGEEAGGINGDAPTYTQFGLSEYIFQRLSGADGKEIEVYVMDMGDAATATELFKFMKNNAVSTLSVEGYDNSTAIMNVFRTTAVYSLYARIDRFYVEFMRMKGFADDTDARTTAKLFLDLYGSRL